MSTKNELTNVQQIVQYAMNKEPSKLKSIATREISARIMDHIQTKRIEVGSKLFGK